MHESQELTRFPWQTLLEELWLQVASLLKGSALIREDQGC